MHFLDSVELAGFAELGLSVELLDSANLASLQDFQPSADSVKLVGFAHSAHPSSDMFGGPCEI